MGMPRLVSSNPASSRARVGAIILFLLAAIAAVVLFSVRDGGEAPEPAALRQAADAASPTADAASMAAEAIEEGAEAVPDSAAVTRLNADDFRELYRPDRPAHAFGLGAEPALGGQPVTRVEDGQAAAGPPPKGLEFVAGWQKRRPGESAVRRIWVVRDSNLPKYQLTRIEELAGPDGRPAEEEAVMVADHLIVRLQPGAGIQDLRPLLDGWGAEVRRELGIDGAFLVAFDGTIPERMESLGAALEADPRVRYAEPDGHAHLNAFFPDDPEFAGLWGMHNTGQTGGRDDVDIDGPEAWGLVRGSRDVTVGVIDTGIDYTHPDLAANMWMNEGETGLDRLGQDKSRNGSDDDGNGYVDDVYGYDFVNDDGDPMDEHFHGTHVAGTVGAVGGNGEGVTGVIWETRLIALKIFHTSGRGDSAFFSDAAQAIAYATEHGARLTNNSWGGTRTSQLVEDAIAEARDEGILFVAAAGNSSRDIDETKYYPAAVDLDNVITVAAVDHAGELAFFSNFGAVEVDLGAPGVDIVSTVPTGSENIYGRLNGTSMAAPHVAGALALMFAADPGLTASEARAALLSGVEPLESLDTRTTTGGMLNLANAVSSLGLVVESTEVREAGDSLAENDGILNPGETVVVSLTVNNPTGLNHQGVTATLDASEAPELTVIRGSVELGALAPGETAAGGEAAFEFVIGAEVATPKVFNLPVVLSSDRGEWRSSVLLEAAASHRAGGVVRSGDAPLADAEIAWAPIYGDGGDPLRRVVRSAGGTTTSDAEGAWELTLPEGGYVFSVSYPGALSPDPLEAVLPPDRTDIDFTFQRAEVSGQVFRRATGEPIAGATVEYAGTIAGETVTGAGGAYQFEILLARATNVRVRATAPEATPSRWQTLRVPPSETGVDFHLGAPELVISAESLSARAAINGQAVRSFDVRNDGDEPLTFGVFNEEIETRVRSSGIGSVQRQFTLPFELHEASLYWPRPYGIAWTGESLWVVNGSPNLFQIDEHNGTLLETVPLDLPEGSLIHGVGWDGRFFWLADYLGRRIFAYDPAKGGIVRELDTAESWSEVNPPNGVTFARGQVWAHRGGLHLLDFIRRYASFDPFTGELGERFNFVDSSTKGLHNSFVFDNGRFYHSATNHDQSTIAEGPRDLDDLLSRDELDENTRNYQVFQSPFQSVFDVSTDREGRLWAIGSKTVVDGRQAFMKVALFNGRREIWLTQSPHQITLDPGEATEITVRADARKSGEGAHEALMVLRTNDPARPEVPLLFHFDVSASHSGNRAPAINTPPAGRVADFPGDLAVSVAASDLDGDELTYHWSKQSGPGEVVFSPNGDETASAATANFSAPGDYALRVAVSDGIATTTAEFTVRFSGSDLHAIQGTVTLDGDPAAGARVAFSSPEIEGYVLTGNDGAYALSLPDGEYQVVASFPDAVPSAAASIRLPGDEGPGFDFTTATIRGRVVDAVSGEALPEAAIAYRTAASDGELAVDEAATFAHSFVTGRPAELFLRASWGGHRSSELRVSTPPYEQDVELAILRPIADVSPAAIDATAAYGERPSRVVTLANDGAGPMEWTARRLLRNLADTQGSASLLDIFTYDAPRGFASVAYGEDTVYICGLDNSIVYRVDARTGEYLSAFEIGDGPSADAMTYDSDRGVIWYGNGGHLLYAMDPDTGEVVDELSMRLTATGPAYHDGLLWVFNRSDQFDGREVIAYDPDTGAFARRFVADLPDAPVGLEFYNGLIWAPTQDALYLIDPLDGSRVGTVDLDGYPEGNDIAMTGDGTFWLVSGLFLFHWRYEDGPWLEAEPTSGVLDPGEAAEVTLRFHTLKAGLGDHHARLEFRTTDPAAEIINVPVDLTVVEGAARALTGVVTRDGAPVDGVEVKLAGDERALSVTDSAGRYRFELVDGDYEVQARREGWQRQDWRPVAINGGDATVDFSWTTGTVSGTVTEELTGETLEGAAVSWEGPLSGETTTGPDGGYEFSEVYSRESEVIVSARAEDIDYVATRTILQPGAANGDLVLFGARLEADPRTFFIQDQPGDTRAAAFTLRNGGFANGLTWALEGLDAIPWLSADVTNGELAASEEAVVTLTFDLPTDLALGTYEESITLTSNDPGSESTTIPITLVATDANEQPGVTITAPEDGASRGYDNVVITAEATDPENAVARVEFLVDGIKAGEVLGNETPHVFTWREASVGEHEVVARVVDDQGSVAEDRIRLFVGEPPVPVMEVDAFPGPAPVTVAFSAENSSDPDGEIIGYRWDTGDIGDVPSTDGDRVVMLEAEHFHADHREHPGTGKWADHYYEVIEDPSASNGLVVRGMPNTGASVAEGDDDTPPGLFYGIDTNQFFNWQIYARVRNGDPQDNRIAWTIYNERRDELYDLGGGWDAEQDALLREDNGEWVWIVTDHADSGTNARTYPMPVMAYMHEDGLVFDKLILTNRSFFDEELEDLQNVIDSPEEIGSFAITPVTHFTFEEDGEYTLHLSVTDNHGIVRTVSRTIYVGERPEARIAASVQSGSAPLTVNFDGGSSTAPGGAGIVDYQWRFGVESVLAEANFLQALDDYDRDEVNDGSVDSSSGAEVELNGNIWRSLDAPVEVSENTILRFEYNREREGELHAIGLDDNAEHEDVPRLFQIDGANTALPGFIRDFNTYRDGDGWLAYEIPVGQYYTGAMDRIALVSVDAGFGDGAQVLFRNVEVVEPAQASGATAGHEFTAPGAYTVELVVTDERGFVDTASVTINVAEAVGEPPVILGVSAAPSTNAYQYGRLQFTTRASDPEGGPLEYRWRSTTDVLADWQPEPTAVLRPETVGEYPIHAQVRDPDGNLAEESLRVTIEAFPGTGGHADDLPGFPRFVSGRLQPGDPIPGALEDDDRNGLPLLAEYIFGLPPGAGPADHAPRLVIGDDGAPELHYTRRSDNDGSLLTHWWSTDLSDWRVVAPADFEENLEAHAVEGLDWVNVRLNGVADAQPLFVMTSVRSPVPLFTGVFYFEAEDGGLGANWAVKTDDPDALGGAYIEIDGLNRTSPPSAEAPENIASYAFTVPEGEEGAFIFYYRILSNSHVDDSFFWRLDGGGWVQENGRPGDGVWRDLPGSPWSALAAGDHTLEITYREDGTKLDAFIVQEAALPAPE